MGSRGRPPKKRKIVARYPAKLIFGVSTGTFEPGEGRSWSCECANPTVVMNIDHLEAIRLVDYVRMPQYCAATIMGVSQTTFHTILWEARRKMGRALVEGKTVIVQHTPHLELVESVVVYYICSECKGILVRPCGSKGPDYCNTCGDHTRHRIYCPKLANQLSFDQLFCDAGEFVCDPCPQKGKCDRKAHDRDQSCKSLGEPILRSERAPFTHRDLQEEPRPVLRPERAPFTHRDPWEDQDHVIKPEPATF